MTESPFTGVIPANVMPFDEDLAIDEGEYRRHLRWIAGIDGVESVVLNGHAAEVASLSRDERRRALAIAAAEIGDRIRMIAGIFADGTSQAAALATDAQAEGADGLLVFPPSVLAWGGNERPSLARGHVRQIAEAAALPVVVFQYPPSTGSGYTVETLLEIASLEPVVAVKEWSQDIVAYERNLRALHALDPPVAVLSSFSASLYASLALGADGVISGMGSVVADLQVQLFEAVKAGDHKAAQDINDVLFPLGQCFYAPPFLDAHNRMKSALVQLGRLQHAAVRPPLLPLDADEEEQIRMALRNAGLLQEAGRLDRTAT